MRTTTFDMIGMTLMAIVTMLTSGGMLTWAYLKEQREGAGAPRGNTGTGRDGSASDRSLRTGDDAQIAEHSTAQADAA